MFCSRNLRQWVAHCRGRDFQRLPLFLQRKDSRSDGDLHRPGQRQRHPRGHADLLREQVHGRQLQREVRIRKADPTQGTQLIKTAVSKKASYPLFYSSKQSYECKGVL